MSEYPGFDEEIIAVDMYTGKVILKVATEAVIFESPDQFIDWLNQCVALIPRIRAAYHAVQEVDQTGITPATTQSAEVDKRNWVVSLDSFEGDEHQIITQIINVTGWQFDTTEIEVLAGPPITIGAGLTMLEAVDLQSRSESQGLSVTLKAINPL